MNKNTKKTDKDINKFYYQLAFLNTILIILSFPVIILFYNKPKNILLTILILNILLIIKFIGINYYYVFAFIIAVVLVILYKLTQEITDDIAPLGHHGVQEYKLN